LSTFGSLLGVRTVLRPVLVLDGDDVMWRWGSDAQDPNWNKWKPLKSVTFTPTQEKSIIRWHVRDVDVVQFGTGKILHHNWAHDVLAPVKLMAIHEMVTEPGFTETGSIIQLKTTKEARDGYLVWRDLLEERGLL
jgi:hypothetical protein